MKELSDLVRQPSISATGEGVKDCAILVNGMMESAGLRTQVFTDGGYSENPLLFGEYSRDASPATVCLYAHYDIVPPADPDLWNLPLYDPVIQGGRMYGAGIADDKAQLFTVIKAIEALEKTGVKSANVKVLFDGEEEQYSPHFADFVLEHKELLKADLLLGVDGEAHETGPVIALGMKGTLFVRLEVNTSEKDLLDGYSPVVPNAIWRLNQVLSSIADGTGKVLIDGFYDSVEPITAEEASWLRKIPFNREGVLSGLKTKRLLADDGLDYYRRLYMSPTCAITGIAGGYGGAGVKNVLPQKASASIDFQIMANQTCDDIEQKLHRHMHKHGFDDVETTTLQKRGPHRIPTDHPYVNLVREGTMRAYGKEPVMTPCYRGAGGVGYEFLSIGIPGIWLPTLRPMENNMQGTDENVRIQDVLDGIVAKAVICNHLGRDR